jgi:DNA invertase Pin-like site-specific DNA recombinase
MVKTSALVAVQYLRMSTERQDLSPELQSAAIVAYAVQHGFSVEGTYLDAGKSGLTLDTRDAMKQLLADVMSPERKFSAVLVYDVSRWGRFQDPDASAYYEYHCRLHGVDVRYVQEPFVGLNTPMASLFKGMKRAMAAEFSRELAIKTSAGQRAAVLSGYQLGIPPALGFRKVAVSRGDKSVRVLRDGERRVANIEHVRWVPAPDDEVAAVRRIFELYVSSRMSVDELSRRVREEGIRRRDGRPLSRGNVYTLLHCEALTGTYVWARAGKEQKKRSSDDTRILRVPMVIEPIVPRELFEAARTKLATRGPRYTRDELVGQLRSALATNPALTATHLTEYGCAAQERFRACFGSVRAAWEAAGARYPGKAEMDFSDRNALQALTGRMTRRVRDILVDAGVCCEERTSVAKGGALLCIAGARLLRVQVIFRRPRRGEMTWHLRKISYHRFDLVLLIRAERSGEAVDSLLMTCAQYSDCRRWLAEGTPEGWTVHADLRGVIDVLGRQPDLVSAL